MSQNFVGGSRIVEEEGHMSHRQLPAATTLVLTKIIFLNCLDPLGFLPLHLAFSFLDSSDLGLDKCMGSSFGDEVLTPAVV